MSEVASHPRPEVPIGPRADATRGSIVETAERLFRSMGYRKTAVADIARELSMSPANVYRFFPSKTAINEAICARILTGLAQLCWSIARGPGAPAVRIRTLFETVEQQTVALFFQDKRMHEMVAAALEEHWGVIVTHLQGLQDALEHIIRDGQASGAFAEMDPARTARLLRAAMVAFSHPAVVQQCAEEDLAGMAAGLADLLIRGLRGDR